LSVACTFPAMIQDWREAWYEGTEMQTGSMFPFGFAQVGIRLTCYLN